MSLAVVALALVVITAFALGMRARIPRRRAVHSVPDHAARATAAAAALTAAPAWQPASDRDAPAAAAAIEAALIAGDADRALATAEIAVAAAPESAAARVWLAWALCGCAEPAAALVQLDHARSLDPAAARAPLAIYLAARARHLAFEVAAGTRTAMPPLVTAGDLAVVTLAGTHGGGAWLSGAAEVDVSAAELTAAVSEHRTATAAALGLALDALDAAPGFTDAAYLAARLAIKSGAIEAGRALFAAVAPRIFGRPDAEAFARDVADLDDPSGAVTAAMQAPPPATAPTAKRSRSLRVLP